jgi:uncharacterized lipoprotein YajG
MIKKVMIFLSFVLFLSGCTQTTQTTSIKPEIKQTNEQKNIKKEPTVTISKETYKPRNNFVQDNITTTTLEL